MWDWIRQWTGHPELVDVAAQLIRQCDIPARDERGVARAVQEYVQHNVKYFRESPERFQSPLRTLQWGIGDCDDMAILLACILRSFRIPTRLKFLRMQFPDGPKSHVYGQTKVPDTATGRRLWTSLETVRPVPMGFDFESFARGRGIPTRVELIGDES